MRGSNMDNLLPLILTALKTIDRGKSIRSSLRAVSDNTKISKEDESILYFSVFEIYKKLNLIDMYIKTSSSSFSLKKIEPENRSLFRLSTYLLKIKKKPVTDVYNLLQGNYSQIGGLNFLDILKSIEAIEEFQLLKDRDDLSTRLSLQFFLPTWIIRRFINQRGEEFTLELLQSLLKNLPLYVRVNTLKSRLEKVERSLKEQDIQYSRVNEITNLLKIETSPVPIPRIKEHIRGEIVVQQKASAVVSIILNPKKGERILDMCASPGGKTSHIAALMGTGKGITAVDINDERTMLLKNRLKLLHVKGIETIKTDARELYKSSNSSYDKILLDPPCSGSGTYSSRPENRWRLKPRDLQWYVNLQKELLEAAASLIKENGTIIYSTCSLFQEENSTQIRSFLQENTDFYLEKTNPTIGIQTEIDTGVVQEVFPHLHQTEGFFIAKIKRK